jgi:hypothetical protein
VIERFLLTNVPTAVLAIGMAVLAVALTLGGFIIVRRRFDRKQLVDQHDVAGFLFAVVGVIYAVLLAFVVVIQWEQYSSDKTDADAEADAVGNLYRDGVALGQSGRALRMAVSNYAHDVAYVEWPYMARHQQENRQTDIEANLLWKAVVALRPPNPPEVTKAIVARAVEDVSAVSERRRTRVRDSADLLPGPIWLVLLVGAVLTVGFCYFFSLESFRAQATMLSILATLIALSLFVILTLDLPFSGGVAATPRALIDEIQQFCGYRYVDIGAGCELPPRASPKR